MKILPSEGSCVMGLIGISLELRGGLDWDFPGVSQNAATVTYSDVVSGRRLIHFH